MAIELELNGKRVEATKEQIFDAALKGKINPETKVWVNGVENSVGRIKGIQFPNANNAALPLPPIQETSTPENTQTLPPPFYNPKKQWVYNLLGFFLYGAHSIYAGYIFLGIIKLLGFLLLTLFVAGNISDDDFYLWMLDPFCPPLWVISIYFLTEKPALGMLAVIAVFLNDLFSVTKDANGVPFE